MRHGTPRSAVSCGQILLERNEESGASSHAGPSLSPVRSPLRQREGNHRNALRRRGSEADLLFPHSLSSPAPALLPPRGVPRSGDFCIQPGGDGGLSPARRRQSTRLSRPPSAQPLGGSGAARGPRRASHAPRLSLDEHAFVSAALTPGRRVSSGVDPADYSLSPTALAAEQTSPYGAAMDVVASARQLMEECSARGIQWELEDWQKPEAPRKSNERMPQSASAGLGVAERTQAEAVSAGGRAKKAGRQRAARGQVVAGRIGAGGKAHHRMVSVDELLADTRQAGLSNRAAGGGGGGGVRPTGVLSTKVNGGVGGIDLRFFQEFDDLPRELLHEMLAANADELGVFQQRNDRIGAKNRARADERAAPGTSRRGAKGSSASGISLCSSWEGQEADVGSDMRGWGRVGNVLMPKMRNDKAEDSDLYGAQSDEDAGDAEGAQTLREQLMPSQQPIAGKPMLRSRMASDSHSAFTPPSQGFRSGTPPRNAPLPRKRRESPQFPSCASVPSFQSSSPPSLSAKDRLPPAVPRATSKQSVYRTGSVVNERYAGSSPTAPSLDHGNASSLGYPQPQAAAELGTPFGPKARGARPEQQQPRHARKYNSGSQLDVFAGFRSHSRTSSSGSVTAGGSGNCARWEAFEAALLACAEASAAGFSWGNQADSDVGTGLHGPKWGNLSLGLGGLELQGALESAVPNLKPTDFVLRLPYDDIKGRYSLGKKEIGEGRFGTIRTCLERATGQVYACKTILKKTIEVSSDVLQYTVKIYMAATLVFIFLLEGIIISSLDQESCFLLSLQTIEDADDVRREVTFLAMLRGHPSVITLQEVFEDDKAIHLVMELCAGGDLFDRIKSQGQIPEPDAALVLKQLLEALLHCRSLGILHRDIKPENILLCSPSENVPIKLIDFGVATVLEEGAMCREMAGTPEYMAPEVLDECYNYEADVWSAGVSLYVMLSGVPPFWESSNRTLEEAIKKKKVVFKYWKWATVSEEAKDLITRMLEKDPLDRITAREVLAHPWIQKHTKAAR
ncbi:unnamed protein product [Closterium sp. Naga37s-1]|nr:unnamed protein product [Closterium sp. Naga37s-1]